MCIRDRDLELLDWLQQYTYPEEAHYADPTYARLGYSYFVRDLKDVYKRQVIYLLSR